MRLATRMYRKFSTGMKGIFVSGILLALSCVSLQAQESEITRPVESQYSLEIGGAYLAETYLSPLKYSGWTLGLSHSRAQAMRFSPEKWLMELGGRFNFDRTLNVPARNSLYYNLNLTLQWAMLRKWRLPKGFTAYAGGCTSLSVGAGYMPRNGNNPVAAKASWTIGPRGGVAWNGHIGKYPLVARYMVDIPLTGVFFSPEYGELYYEIYLGNHSGLFRGAWPGNFFRMDNLLTVDIYLGATALRLGYAPRVFTSKASNIVTRNVTHSFVVGVAHSWMSIGPEKTLTESRKIISAY